MSKMLTIGAYLPNESFNDIHKKITDFLTKRGIAQLPIPPKDFRPSLRTYFKVSDKLFVNFKTDPSYTLFKDRDRIFCLSQHILTSKKSQFIELSIVSLEFGYSCEISYLNHHESGLYLQITIQTDSRHEQFEGVTEAVTYEVQRAKNIQSDLTFFLDLRECIE